MYCIFGAHFVAKLRKRGTYTNLTLHLGFMLSTHTFRGLTSLPEFTGHVLNLEQVFFRIIPLGKGLFFEQDLYGRVHLQRPHQFVRGLFLEPY